MADLRFMKKEPVIPDAYELTDAKVRNPLVYDLIQRLVGNLTLNPHTYSVPLPQPGPEGQRRASHLEKAVAALVDRLEEDAGKNLRYRYMDQAVWRGEGIIKVLLRMDRWDKMPDRDDDDSDTEYVTKTNEYKKTAKLPVCWRIPDRRTVYPVSGEDGDLHVIEITERPLSAIWQAFPGKDTKQKTKDWLAHVGLPVPEDATEIGSQRVTLIEYWDAEHAVYAIVPNPGDTGDKSLCLNHFKHGYGRVPYFRGAGEENSSDDPNESSVPSAFPMAYIAQMYDVMMSMWLNTGVLTGFPTPQVLTQPDVIEAQLSENSDQEQEATTVAVGEIVDMGPGKKLEMIDFGKANQALTGMVAEMKSLMQAVSMPSIMQGIPPGSRTAGAAISELANAAKAKYQTIVTNGERTFAEAINFTLMLLEKKVNAPVYLLSEMTDPKTTRKYQDYLELTPKDIKGYYAVRVKIQPKNPMERIQEGTFLGNLYQQGLLDPARVLEGVGYDQPDEVLDDIQVYEALKAPEVQQIIRQKAMQKAGLQGLLQDAEAAKQLFMEQMATAQQMAGGGGARPAGAGARGPAPGQGSNGQGGPMATPGRPAGVPSAPNGMEVPGMSAPPGQGMPLPGQGAVGALPRMYRRKPGQQAGQPSGRAGITPRQPARPGIEGFRGRG